MRKLIALFTAVIAALCLFPAGAFASRTGELHIKSADDLREFSKNCVLERYSENLTVTLDNDIDLSGSVFEPIPLFKGSFDGGDHTISGLEISRPLSTAGMFRLILPEGRVTRLRVEGASVSQSGAELAGGIAAENRGLIAECSFTGNIRGSSCVGGVAGLNSAEGVIENCTASGSVEGLHRVGGVAGENDGVIRFCVNEAAVNTETTDTDGAAVSGELIQSLIELRLSAEEIIDITDIGGIAGRCGGVIRGCENRGTVGHINIGYNIGGCAGRLSGYIAECINTGAVNGRKDVGGIAGQIDPHTEWDVSGSVLTLLREKLAAFNEAANALAEDVSDSSGTLSGELADLFASIESAEDSLDTLSGDVVDFTNANIDVLNRLSARVTEAVKLIAPAADAFAESTEGLPSALRELSGAFGQLKRASLIVGENSAAASDALHSAENSAGNIRRKLDELIALLDGLSADPGSADMSEVLSALTGTVSVIRSEFSIINSSLTILLNSVAAAGEAGEPVARAMEKLENASSKTAACIEKFNAAADAVSVAFDTLSRYDALSFTPVNNSTETRKALFDSLSEINSACTGISALIGEQTLSGDLGRLTSALTDLIDTALASLSGISVRGGEDMLEDISDKALSLTDGTVSSCVSEGPVCGEINAGGVAGAVTFDFEFDLEDQFDLSSLLSNGAKYSVYAGLIDCSSSCRVTARMTDAGGVAGRMDFGAAVNCGSTAEVSAHDEYAGGIAGRCAGVIRGCKAHTRVSSKAHAGGLAGAGRDITGCLSMGYIDENAVFRGSIAGDADGEVRNNYYLEGMPGGVNGFSFTGGAEPVSYEALYRKSGCSELFGAVRVQFACENGDIVSVTVPYGGSVSDEDIPNVDDRGDQKWRWDDFGRDSVTSNLRVEGRFISPIPVLRTMEEPALFLAEGVFDESDILSAHTYVPDTEASGLDPAKLMGAYTVSAGRDTDKNPRLILHYREGSEGTLYLFENGTPTEAEYRRDGSYIVFSIENGGSFAYMKKPPLPAWGVAAIAAGGAALVVIAAVITIRSVRKRRNRSDGRKRDLPAADTDR